MSLTYTDEAKSDLQAIADYGIDNNLPDPLDYVLSLRQRLEDLHNTRMRGRPSVAIRGARDWVVPPYVAVFRESGADDEVLRVLHGAMQWPPEETGGGTTNQ